MTIIALQGALIGLGASVGLFLIVSRLPIFRKAKLDDRVSPYVRDAGVSTFNVSGARTVTPFPTLELIFRPYLRNGARSLERVLGGGNIIKRKLAQAGLDMTVEEFRVEQLIWGGVAFAAGLVVSVLAVATSGPNPILLVILCFLAFILGISLRDRQLSTQVTKREARIITEFPTVADMLALSVTAGEGPVAALERVAAISKGELAKEFRLALADARTGVSLIDALERIGDRTNIAALARFVDGIAVSVERGTPLADVMRAQAGDVREMSKRQLLEAGGRKEVGMMVPIVFLVLPTVILFAFFPGALGIQAITG